jgi:hypothetical protein
MSTAVVESLILDLLEWLDARDRTYDQVMEVWRTSCPRLTVWEDANERGLIAIRFADGHKLVQPTPSGRTLLQQRRLRSDPIASAPTK